MLKACMKRVDITPPQGLELAGYPHYPRNNKGFHDPLYAACLYLSNGTEEVAFITLDLLFFSKQHTKKIRALLEAECGMKGANIMVSCSHTHSGPWASGRLDIESLEAGKEQPKEYVAFLIQTIKDLIIDARKDAFDAQFACGYELCGAESGVGGNRRIPGGPHDPKVSFMAIKDAASDLRGAMINYTLHPTFIHEWSEVCTADYPCYLKMEIEEAHPKCLTGFAQGTSGNQSSRYYRQGESYDEAERVGRTLGKAALKAIAKAEWKDDLTIKVASKEIEVPIRNFGTEEELRAQVEHDEKIYKDLYAKYGDSKNRDEYYLWQNANLKLLGSEDQLGYILMEKKGIKVELKEEEVPAEIQVVRLGDACVIGLPGEVFVEYGLYLKAVAGFDPVIINELANGVLPGYLYTPESLITGGYETDTSMIAKEFGEALVNTAIALTKEVR